MPNATNNLIFEVGDRVMGLSSEGIIRYTGTVSVINNNGRTLIIKRDNFGIGPWWCNKKADGTYGSDEIFGELVHITDKEDCESIYCQSSKRIRTTRVNIQKLTKVLYGNN